MDCPWACSKPSRNECLPWPVGRCWGLVLGTIGAYPVTPKVIGQDEDDVWLRAAVANPARKRNKVHLIIWTERFARDDLKDQFLQTVIQFGHLSYDCIKVIPVSETQSSSECVDEKFFGKAMSELTGSALEISLDPRWTFYGCAIWHFSRSVNGQAFGSVHAMLRCDHNVPWKDLEDRSFDGIRSRSDYCGVSPSIPSSYLPSSVWLNRFNVRWRRVGWSPE